VAEASHALFLSYGSQDAEAVQEICDAVLNQELSA
jgi:hypothetical protein